MLLEGLTVDLALELAALERTLLPVVEVLAVEVLMPVDDLLATDVTELDESLAPGVEILEPAEEALVAEEAVLVLAAPVLVLVVAELLVPVVLDIDPMPPLERDPVMTPFLGVNTVAPSRCHPPCHPPGP